MKESTTIVEINIGLRQIANNEVVEFVVTEISDFFREDIEDSRILSILIIQNGDVVDEKVVKSQS